MLTLEDITRATLARYVKRQADAILAPPSGLLALIDTPERRATMAAERETDERAYLESGFE